MDSIICMIAFWDRGEYLRRRVRCWVASDVSAESFMAFLKPEKLQSRRGDVQREDAFDNRSRRGKSAGHSHLFSHRKDNRQFELITGITVSLNLDASSMVPAKMQ